MASLTPPGLGAGAGERVGGRETGRCDREMGGGACLGLSSWVLWGPIVAWGGGGGRVMGNKRGEPWVSFVHPNFQFILLPGAMAMEDWHLGPGI